MTDLKFFSSALIARMHSDQFDPRESEKARARYHAYLKRWLPKAPQAIQRFARMHFHDCSLKRITSEDTSRPPQLYGKSRSHSSDESARIVLEFEGFKHFSRGGTVVGQKGSHAIEFHGVTDTNIAISHLGGYWGWSELHKTRAGYELRLSMEDCKSPILTITFRTIAIKSAPSEARLASRQDKRNRAGAYKTRKNEQTDAF
jgi:hypothetical protein